jgi:hypothetical protein
MVGHAPGEAPQWSVSHCPYSSHLTARPSPRNRLLLPPLRASALLLGPRPTLPLQGPTVPAPQRSNKNGPLRAFACRERHNGHYLLD